MSMKDEIDAALQAHAAWRKRFKDFLAGHTAFDIDAVAATDQCDFGRWLARDGHRLIPGELCDSIHTAHADFHRVAGTIVARIKQKQFEAAHRDLAADGAFNQASTRLSDLLHKAALLEPGTGGSVAPAAPSAPAAPAGGSAGEAAPDAGAQAKKAG